MVAIFTLWLLLLVLYSVYHLICSMPIQYYCVGGHNDIFLFMRAIFMVHMSVSHRWVTQQLNYWCCSSYFVIFCTLPLLTLVINTQLSGYELHSHHITAFHLIKWEIYIIFCKWGGRLSKVVCRNLHYFSKINSIRILCGYIEKVMAYLSVHCCV